MADTCDIPSPKTQELAHDLRKILETYKDRRAVVVGTTCTGKTTLLKDIPDARDMDELVFPLLSKEESDYVCQTPWTPEIGATMTRLTKERVRVWSGKPVFGTVLLPCDLVIYLHISDALLKERTQARGANFEDAKKMQSAIENELSTVRIPIITLSVG